MLIPFSVESSRDWEHAQDKAVAVPLLVLTCIIVHVVIWRLHPEQVLDIMYRFGVVKYDLRWYSFFTCTFLHGGWLHLFGNMLFLWVYGVTLEKLLGSTRFLLTYFIGNIISIMLHLLTLSTFAADVPTIGASGAISAVLGAFFVMLPGSRLKCALIVFIRPLIMNLPAWLVLGLWFIGQLYYSIDPLAGSGQVAFWAHVGGFCAGALGGAVLDWQRRRAAAMNAGAWQTPWREAWRLLGVNRLDEARQAYEMFKAETCFPGPHDDPVLAVTLIRPDAEPEVLTAMLEKSLKRALDRLDLAGAVTVYLAILDHCGFDEIDPALHRLAGNAAMSCNLPWIALRAYCCAFQTGLKEGGDDIIRRTEAACRHKLKNAELADRLHRLQY